MLTDQISDDTNLLGQRHRSHCVPLQQRRRREPLQAVCLFHSVTPTDNLRKVSHFRCHLRLSDMSSIEHWGIRISYCRLKFPSQRRNLSRDSEILSQKI
jgi:hypothetical protein